MQKLSLKQQFVRLFTVLAITGTFVLAANAQFKIDKDADTQNANGVESGYASILIGL
jgi:hypothetical protein